MQAHGGDVALFCPKVQQQVRELVRPAVQFEVGQLAVVGDHGDRVPRQLGLTPDQLRQQSIWNLGRRRVRSLGHRRGGRRRIRPLGRGSHRRQRPLVDLPRTVSGNRSSRTTRSGYM